jgi:hypothetical protein
MSKVFRRPMFRGGSTNMNGIMSGIEDRKNYSIGTESPSAGDRYKEIYDKYAQPTIDPLGKYLIQGSLQGFSENRGGSTLGNLGLAFGGENLNQLFSDIEGQRTGKRDMELAKLGYDIDEETRQENIARENELRKEDIGIAEATFIRENEAKIAAEKLKGENADARLIKELQNNIDVANIKSKTTLSNFQKDFTPDRKYYELMKDRTNSAAEIKYGQRANVEQKFPRGTAQFDAYYSTDLLQSDNPVAKEIRSSFERFVPFDSKKGTLNYSDMIPGMYYYDPKRNVYITNVPPSDEDAEGGFYIVNPSTYEKRKLNP